MRRLAALLFLFALTACQTIAVETTPTITRATEAPSLTTGVPPMPTTSTVTAATTTTPSSALPYLVWASGGLDREFAESLAEWGSATVVDGDMVELIEADETIVPLDAVAIDPTTYRAFFDRSWLDDLTAGTVVLSRTSAELRQSKPGDTLRLAGVDYVVGAIVDDSEAGYAEVVFHRADPNQPVTTTRYALVLTVSERPAFEAELEATYPGPTPVTVRTSDQTRWMRHGDAVLPQIYIKEALGEFFYRNRRGADFDQEPAFTSGRIATVELPLVGAVKCHEVVIEMLAGALDQIVAEGLADTIDPAGFAGCWYPRLIRTVSGSPAGVSRHSWGAAVDLNAPANPLGGESAQHPRLVEIMRRWGFNWGGDWLVPDPMHFEYGISPGS